jgi:hypothetical protein
LALTLPLPVVQNRFLAADLVFIFGIFLSIIKMFKKHEVGEACHTPANALKTGMTIKGQDAHWSF